MIRNQVNHFQYLFRSRILGKVILRPGLPVLSNQEALESEHQFYRLLLERAFLTQSAPTIQEVIDVGCRNWSYVQALAEFFPQSRLTGIEVDGWRRYWNLYRRIDQAKAYAEALKRMNREATALAMDFRDWKPSRQPQSEGISSPPLPRRAYTFFFPFVSDDPCLRWGLPLQFANFSELLEHSLENSLGAGSTVWISAHQGEWEAKIAREAYHRLGFQIFEETVTADEAKGLWPSPFSSHLFRCERPHGGKI